MLTVSYGKLGGYGTVDIHKGGWRGITMHPGVIYDSVIGYDCVRDGGEGCLEACMIWRDWSGV